MQKKWQMGKKYQSTVSDWKKLIIDFRDQFPYDPVTALIVETFANALDAKAMEIKIYIKDDVFKIIDNGMGMTQYEFEQYHNIASLTKRKGEGIGFAGVGAKIFLDGAVHIATETKSKDFHGATLWTFHGEIPEWKPIKPPNILSYKTGTCVEVKLKEEDKEKLTPNFIKQVLHQFYNGVLLGHYNVKRVTINNIILKSWQPEDIEIRKEINIRVGKRIVKGFLIKTKQKLPECFQGPSIVVYGKTVTQEWFRQYPIGGEYLTGLIFADYLIEILRTSKSDFDRTSMLWRYFHNRVGSFIGTWLDEIGAKPKPPKVSYNLQQLSSEIEGTINNLLKLPEFSDLANKIFQNIIHRQVAIKTRDGELTGSKIEGIQKTSGTTGGQDKGEGVPIPGNEEGKGVIEDETGDVPIERIRRKVKGGIRINFDKQPENLLEGWIDPSIQAVVINTGHPAWKIADELYSQAYHLLRTAFTVLIEETSAENPKEIIAGLFSKLPAMG